MIGIIIATHDHLADSLLKTAESILGEQSCVETLNIEPGATGLQEKIEDYAKDLLTKVDELVWLVDMFGGTPFRYASYCVMDDSRQSLVTGVNSAADNSRFTKACRTIGKLTPVTKDWRESSITQ